MSDELNEQVLDDLRVATERLTEQVATLSGALQTVNHLQARQQEIDAKADHAVSMAKSVREDVTENAVTKTEFAKSVKDEANLNAIARALQQRRLRIFAIGASLLACVIALMAVGFAYEVNRARLGDQQQSRVELCEQGNAARTTAANQTRDYFAPKLVQEQENPHADPVLVSILQQLANSQPQLLACPKP